MTIIDAIHILNAASHRGARYWYWDPALLRVLPAEWNGVGEDPATAFTVFEVLCVARGLAQIGATGPVPAAPA